MSTDHAATTHRYDGVWNELDAGIRLATLAEVWADDGFYADADAPAGFVGREALSDFIGRAHEAMPGLAIRATSELAVLGDRAWYRWEATTADGSAFLGLDFVEFAPDGRIARLTGFYET